MTRTSAAIDYCEGIWMRRWILFGPREWTPPNYKIRSGTFPDREIGEEEYAKAEKDQKQMPVVLAGDHRRYLWWFRDEFYYHDREEDNPEVIKGLIIQKLERDAKRRKRAIDTAREYQEE
jgi:hypothetical protein